ncbi:MAG TPA: addiction module killer protein [Cyanothece sp. UBA12306]|nr:addiction module killer protein [Cyanothece sp. UBA12306]
MEAQPREIQIYVSLRGDIPFKQWYNSLKDPKVQYKIDVRLERVALGNLGDHRSVGDGVCELKINYGSGYRVYFGQKGNQLILLLCGGDKKTQQKDIIKAKEYWKDYEQRQNDSESKL